MAARMLDGQSLVVSSFAVYGWFMLVSIYSNKLKLTKGLVSTHPRMGMILCIPNYPVGETN